MQEFCERVQASADGAAYGIVTVTIRNYRPAWLVEASERSRG
jgi:hypothetical protein